MATTADLPLPEKESDGFHLLSNGHKDMVGVTAFNSYGDRFATSCVDGRIKIYNRHKDNTWNLCDTWAAHTAEILQVQWLPPSIHPNLIASIATDGRFKLWVEDPTIAPNKGRRFNSHQNRPLFELRSSQAPYVAFALTHNSETRHTYLALIMRSGSVIVYENEEAENVDSWTEMDNFKVCEKPARGDETSFKIAFDPNLEPCYAALRQGVPRDSLALVVASMNRAAIWRTKQVEHTNTLGSSSTKEFYLATELKGHRGLVRDVAWAPGNIRGFDLVATACKDGFVRVFEIRTPPADGRELRSKDYARIPDPVIVHTQKGIQPGIGNSPSGIGAELAGAKGGLRPANREGEVTHVSKEVAKLEANRTPVWKVGFDSDGLLLGSTGDDGKLMIWRRQPDGNWCKSSELAMARQAV